ncbi:hypothetical protein BC829DRAFT_288028 [Chytridium lagenaria]|nr:hypothetical protein BC829DRAFT_288028 [Chytridium lagenaria]
MPPKVESSECAVVAAAFPQLQISVRPADACCTLISQSVNITCTDENRITGLWIRSRAVTGPIPMSMFQLTSLTDLTLSDTGVVGAIPSDISLLTNLERLTLLNNAGINGAIPSEIYALPKLSNLVAIGSRLSGSLTSSISNLQSLIELRLDRNSLEGSIPTELGSLPLLQEISIQANMFRGAIPNEINNLRALRLFDGRTNYLWGTVPSGLESVARAARCNIGTDCVRLSANCFDTKDLAVNWSNATRRPDSECAPYLPTNITPTDSSPIPTQTNSVAIGVGVGLTLLFILTALTAFLIYKRKTPSTPTPTKLESSPPSHLPAWLVNATREPSLPSWVMMPVTSVAGWKRTEKGKEREKPLTPVEGGERGLSVVHTMENKEEEKSEGLVDEKKGGLFAIANGEAAATKSLTATFPQTMTTVPPPTSKSATSSGSLFPVPADAHHHQKVVDCLDLSPHRHPIVLWKDPKRPRIHLMDGWWM